MEKISNKAREVAKVFDDLPDSGVVETGVTSLVTSLSQRTVRYHPKLPQHRISRGRVGQNVGDIRRLLRGDDTA